MEMLQDISTQILITYTNFFPLIYDPCSKTSLHSGKKKFNKKQMHASLRSASLTGSRPRCAKRRTTMCEA